MILHVVEAKYFADYTIWLKFNNGAIGEIDLKGELDGEVFEPLKVIENFKKFRLIRKLKQLSGKTEQI